MKKKIILRSLSGFPIGLSIGYMITILISLFWGNGSYVPCVPELTAMAGSEIHAVFLQALLSGIVGSGFAASSVIWELEDWGIVKQTGIYFFIISIIMMPAAYVMYWMEHSIKGVLIYFGIFVFIFVILWIVLYAAAWRNVKKMNETLSGRRESENR